VHFQNFEASELFSRPTETLLRIRRKWENGQSISHGEWQVLGDYLQTGCESPTEERYLPSPESYAVLVEAFVAALALRSGKNPQLDYEYLGNISLEPQVPGTVVTVEEVIEAARQQIRRLRKPSSTHKWLPIFIGRNLCFLSRSGSEGLKPSMRRCGLT